MEKRDLLLITGIPGTGKTTYGDKLAKDFGFLHVDLEVPATLDRFNASPEQFISELLDQNNSVVITWGFGPACVRSNELVQKLRTAGFDLIWFDGNRPTALREFQKRGTASEKDFYYQMFLIEATQLVARLTPRVINSFDDDGHFKPTDELLTEIRAEK